MEERLYNMTFGQALIISVVIAGLYWVAMFDDGSLKENQIKQLRQEIGINQRKLENIKRAVEDAERYKAAAAALGKKMDRIYAAIPSDLSEIQVMKLLSKEAKTVGLNIADIQVGRDNFGVKSDQFVTYIRVNVELVGTFSQLLLYMSNLTKVDKVLKAKDFTFAVSDNNSSQDTTSSDGNPLLKYSANFYAYKYIPDEKEAGNAQ